MEIPEHHQISDYMEIIESKQNAPGICWKKDVRPTQHLKLDISDSFLTSIRLMLAWYRNDSTQIKYSDRSTLDELKTAQKQLRSAKKEVPTELPLLTLSVGNKKLIRTDECAIFARFYYRLKKVVCQMRNGTLYRRVEIPCSNITALHVSFDHRRFDTLRIEAKVSFECFSADNTRPGKFPDWKVEDTKDIYSFPESTFAFLTMETGMLEKGFAKLLYTDPGLERVVRFSRGTCSDQRLQHGLVNSQMQQINMSALHSSSSNIFSLALESEYDLNSSYIDSQIRL